MSLALYMDVHVPMVITRTLRQRGIDVLTAQEDGFDLSADQVVLDRAGALHRLLFTQDTDFLREVAYRQRIGKLFSGVIFAQQVKVPISVCIRDLEFICRCALPGEFDRIVQYLPLR